MVEETAKKRIRKRRCKVCGSYRAVIKKYDLMMCRRCFKELAPRLGFKKYQ
jgi:small subunit ribosomal protein S14